MEGTIDFKVLITTFID